MMFSTKTKLLLLIATSLTACSTINDLTEEDKIDYKTPVNKERSRLEVPPDLTKPTGDQRYAVPGTETASNYQNASIEANKKTILPEVSGVSIKRDGSQRWLVANRTPEELWPVLRQFWEDSGFSLVIDNPTTGIMETEWAENRAKLPQDIIRRTIGKVLDGFYSTSERDKFRLRVERAQDGGSEIYITHRGMQEELVGSQKERSIWTKRPADPELEAEFLSRLMVRLGAKADDAKASITQTNDTTSKTVTPAAKPISRVTLVNGNPALPLSETVEHAWRLLGLALDRINFTVEDRNRSQGIYFVRYVSDKDNEKKGFFDKLFSSNTKKKAQRYQIKLSEQDVNHSVITVLNESGQPETGNAAKDILGLLDQQLR